MDPRTNPYAPGAGTKPPELAGRDELIEKAAIALDRFRKGLSARSLLLVGLRGVGKTVLLNRIAQEAEARGFVVVQIEAPENVNANVEFIPVHVPDQPLNTDPTSGVAVNIAAVLFGSETLQVAPQTIPLPETVPVPVPALEIVKIA